MENTIKKPNYLSPERLPDESFQDYKNRRAFLNAKRKEALRTGVLLHVSRDEHGKGVTAKRHPTQHPKSKVKE